ncbi:MAG: hypothetical protein OEY95_06920 [Candidatus Bathyarchaeota archaeon]|nr:hypothetical protein [Candidatus Bathyarchaeota archaeon]MDH5754915.1 hypothetical protein [Candidatus Bathyarchaeota archaeon]
MDPASVFDLIFMLVATVLTILSLNTLQMLARIKVDRSLFIPVMLSAVFFWCGSIMSLVFRIYLESTPGLIIFQDTINLLHQVALIIGLSILTYGVFSYWKITKHVKVAKYERSHGQGEDEEEQ